MTETPDRSNSPDSADLPYDSMAGAAGRRGDDDRRGRVNPAQNPAPSSPAPDEDAIRKGEDNLDSVKPY